MSESAPLHVFQIYYSEATRQQLDPGFTPLDNLSNQRPDWREYWPMRNYLLTQGALDENAYYGFFSPKFHAKTGLTAQDVFSFVQAQEDRPEVISFSPYFDQIAIFFNIFEQGEAHHAGLLAASQQFMQTLGMTANLMALPGHTQNTVYSNFFVAKPSFWREWLRINEALFALCETNASELAIRLNAMTMHDGAANCPLKVFVMERTTSLLLSLGAFRNRPYKPTTLPRTNSPAAALGDELLIADALKIAYTTTQDRHYLDAFDAVRRLAIQRINPS